MQNLLLAHSCIWRLKGHKYASLKHLRPKKGATVSTPIDWSEVKEGLDPKNFNIHTIAERLREKGDLFAPMLDKSKVIDLGKCLENLSSN